MIRVNSKFTESGTIEEYEDHKVAFRKNGILIPWGDDRVRFIPYGRVDSITMDRMVASIGSGWANL